MRGSTTQHTTVLPLRSIRILDNRPHSKCHETQCRWAKWTHPPLKRDTEHRECGDTLHHLGDIWNEETSRSVLGRWSTTHMRQKGTHKTAHSPESTVREIRGRGEGEGMTVLRRVHESRRAVQSACVYNQESITITYCWAVGNEWIRDDAEAEPKSGYYSEESTWKVLCYSRLGLDPTQPSEPLGTLFGTLHRQHQDS